MPAILCGDGGQIFVFRDVITSFLMWVLAIGRLFFGDLWKIIASFANCMPLLLSFRAVQQRRKQIAWRCKIICKQHRAAIAIMMVPKWCVSMDLSNWHAKENLVFSITWCIYWSEESVDFIKPPDKNIKGIVRASSRASAHFALV